MNRHDLTDWIIHFIHRRNPENDPLEFSYDVKEMEYIPHPDGFEYDGTPIFLTNKYEEDEYGLAPDDYAICVLKKILHDGYVRAGWSYRNGRPTIYGPKAAVCFTEMPLYGLIDYSKSRNDEYSTEPFGIAFRKEELFLAGARPVIYGLSSNHEEAGEDDPLFGIGLRTLSSKTGLGLKEQYRYVYTKLGSYKKTDWTHEREWRWADLENAFDFPGLPLFARNDKISFSQLIVFVQTTDDREQNIDYLKNLYHSGSTDYGREYDVNIIANTRVLAIDDLIGMKKDITLVKLDDLPLHSIPKIEKFKVREDTISKVKNALKTASDISLKASTDFYNNFNEKNQKVGPCGFSHVITWANSEITQALIDLGAAKAYADGYYHIHGLKSYASQLLDVEEAGMKAAAEYLTRELGQTFSYRSRLD